MNAKRLATAAIACTLTLMAPVVPQGATAATSPSQTADQSDECIPKGEDDAYGFHLGFPRSPLRGPTRGRMQVAAIYVDFDDEPARGDATSIHAQTIPPGLKQLERLSHGQLDAESIQTRSWIRMPQPKSFYFPPDGGEAGPRFFDLVEDAIVAADSELDFSDVDIVGITLEQSALQPPLGVAIVEGANVITADGNDIVNAFVLSHPLNRPDTVVAHEILHNLGLPDLYDYSAVSLEIPVPRHRFVGGFSTMGDNRGHSPELFAWEQWVLGWLDDASVVCLDEGATEVELSAVSARSGTRMAVVPLGGNRFVAVEVRARGGLDSPPVPGVLPYLVSVDTPTGLGPIRVPATRDPLVIDPLPVGTQWVIEGVGLEILSSRGGTYRVRVHPDVPAPSKPGRVGGLRATKSSKYVTVAWTKPLAPGWTTITGYEYRVGKGPWIRTGSERVRIPAAKLKESLRVQVRAVNSSGPGLPSSLSLRNR